MGAPNSPIFLNWPSWPNRRHFGDRLPIPALKPYLLFAQFGALSIGVFCLSLNMKIAFVGKGGSGKTTISALFIRYVASRGLPVIAIDADINQHLPEALGVAEKREPSGGRLDRLTPSSNRLSEGLQISIAISQRHVVEFPKVSIEFAGDLFFDSKVAAHRHLYSNPLSRSGRNQTGRQYKKCNVFHWVFH